MLCCGIAVWYPVNLHLYIVYMNQKYYLFNLDGSDSDKQHELRWPSHQTFGLAIASYFQMVNLLTFTWNVAYRLSVKYFIVIEEFGNCFPV